MWTVVRYDTFNPFHVDITFKQNGHISVSYRHGKASIIPLCIETCRLCIENVAQYGSSFSIRASIPDVACDPRASKFLDTMCALDNRLLQECSEKLRVSREELVSRFKPLVHMESDRDPTVRFKVAASDRIKVFNASMAESPLSHLAQGAIVRFIANFAYAYEGDLVAIGTPHIVQAIVLEQASDYAFVDEEST